MLAIFTSRFLCTTTLVITTISTGGFRMSVCFSPGGFYPTTLIVLTATFSGNMVMVIPIFRWVVTFLLTTLISATTWVSFPMPVIFFSGFYTADVIAAFVFMTVWSMGSSFVVFFTNTILATLVSFS
jgi:hypothetical protein